MTSPIRSSRNPRDISSIPLSKNQGFKEESIYQRIQNYFRPIPPTDHAKVLTPGDVKKFISNSIVAAALLSSAVLLVYPNEESEGMSPASNPMKEPLCLALMNLLPVAVVQQSLMNLMISSLFISALCGDIPGALAQSPPNSSWACVNGVYAPSFEKPSEIEAFLFDRTSKGLKPKNMDKIDILDPKRLALILSGGLGRESFMDPKDIVRRGGTPGTPEERLIRRLTFASAGAALLKQGDQCGIPNGPDSNEFCQSAIIAPTCESDMTETLVSCAPPDVWKDMLYNPEEIPPAQELKTLHCGHREFNKTTTEALFSGIEPAAYGSLLHSLSLEELRSLLSVLKSQIMSQDSHRVRQWFDAAYKADVSRFANGALRACEYDPCPPPEGFSCKLRTIKLECSDQESTTDLLCSIPFLRKSTCFDRLGNPNLPPPPLSVSRSTPRSISDSTTMSISNAKTQSKTKPHQTNTFTQNTESQISNTQSETDSTSPNIECLGAGNCDAYNAYLSMNSIARSLLQGISCGPGGSSTLDLRGRSITGAHAIALVPAIRHLTGLKSVILRTNHLWDGGVDVLVPSLKCLPNIETIDLSANGIGDYGIIKLSEAIQRWPQLRNVVIEENSLGNPSAKALADSLKHFDKSGSFSKLDLSGNNIGDDGASDLANSLYFIKSMTELDLQNNRLSEDKKNNMRSVLGAIRSLNL